MSNFAIILAAGNSTRMGTCKTALPWGENTTLLTYQIQQWLSINFIPIVVLGSHNSHRQAECHPQSIITINPDSQTGKTTSILTGLKHLPSQFDKLAISAVDQPRPAEIYQQLQQSHIENSALITAPTYCNQMGHPLLFSPSLQPDLLHICEETLGLRQIMQKFSNQIHKLEFNNCIVLLDINTPETYHLNFPKFSP